MKAAALLLAVALLANRAPARFTLDCRDVALPDVIRLLAVRTGTNIVADGSLHAARVTLRLRDVTFDEALATLVAAYGLEVHRDGRVLIIGDGAAMSRRFPDDAQAGSPRTRLFSLVHAHAVDVATALKGALPEGTVVIADRRTGSVVVTAAEPTVLRAAKLVAALDVAATGETGTAGLAIVSLRNVKASDAVKAIKGLAPENALIADDRENAVAVAGNEEVRATVRGVLAGLDRPGRQVMFEVRVADVAPINDSENVGIEFGGTGFGSGGLGLVPYTLTRSSLVINAQIDAMVQKGRASILAQPRIATLNNREASLLVGEQYPVVTVNQQTGFPSVQTIDVGVRLRLTPTIGDDGTVVAELHPEFSQIIGFNAAFPIIANRKLDATVRVRNGETIVLGGLFQDVDSETVTKLPVLGDLPVLGAFFRNRERTHNRDEVVFFITPHILGDDASAAP